MRCASRYDDVGPLKYHQHPLFFQTMEPLQLAEIEDNSPVRYRSRRFRDTRRHCTLILIR